MVRCELSITARRHSASALGPKPSHTQSRHKQGRYGSYGSQDYHDWSGIPKLALEVFGSTVTPRQARTHEMIIDNKYHPVMLGLGNCLEDPQRELHWKPYKPDICSGAYLKRAKSSFPAGRRSPYIWSMWTTRPNERACTFSFTSMIFPFNRFSPCPAASTGIILKAFSPPVFLVIAH